MVPDPAPGAEGVDGQVAALRDQRHTSGAERLHRVAPHRRSRGDRHHPVAVWAADRQPPGQGAIAKLTLQLAAGCDLAEPGREHDRSPAPPAHRVGDRRRDLCGRDRDHHRVDRLRKVEHAGHAIAAVNPIAGRVHPPYRALEPGPVEVSQHRVRIRPGPVVGAHHGDRARGEERGRIRRGGHSQRI